MVNVSVTSVAGHIERYYSKVLRAYNTLSKTASTIHNFGMKKKVNHIHYGKLKGIMILNMKTARTCTTVVFIIHVQNPAFNAYSVERTTSEADLGQSCYCEITCLTNDRDVENVKCRMLINFEFFPEALTFISFSTSERIYKMLYGTSQQ